MKAERRRLARETTAYETGAQEALEPASEEQIWEGVSVKLDDCLAHLSESDRHAVLLRFFENRSLAEVGAALGVAEDAARKRVRRALDRLQALLAKAGTRVVDESMESLLQRHAVPSAPQHVLGAAAGATLLGRSIPAKGVDAALGRLARHLLWQQWKPWLTAAAVTVAVSSAAVFSFSEFRPSAHTAVQNADDYRPAGFPRAEKVHAFVHQIQGMTGKEDKIALSKIVRYPLQVNGPNGSQIIQTSAEFIQAFEVLFAGRPSKVILKCPEHGLYCDSRGIMIGAGEIWIGPDRPGAADPQPRIIALNLDR